MKDDFDTNAKVTKPSATKVSKSCDHCKLKKIKCNQVRPICQNCGKYGVECVYSIMKKPGLKTGYGQQVFEQISELSTIVEYEREKQESETESLKQRMKVIEERLAVYERRGIMENNIGGQSLNGGITSGITSGIAGGLTGGISTQINGNINQINGQNIMKSSGNELSSSMSPVITLNPHYSRSELNEDYSNSFSPNQSPAVNEALSSAGLPSVDKTLALVDIYFKYIDPIFPILHHDVEYPKLVQNLNSSNVLLVAVLLNALKFANHIIPNDKDEFWFDSLKKIVISSCYAVKNIEELKSITLTAFALYGRSKNHEAWSLISLAVGGCLHLGLTRDPNNFQLPDNDESLETNQIIEDDWQMWSRKESLRVLVWEIYKLDRLSSISSHFIPKLPSDEIGCLLPIKSDLWKIKGLFNKKLIEKGPGQNQTLKGGNKDINLDIYGSNCYIIEVLDLMEECSSFRKTPMDIKDMKTLLAWQLTSYNFEIKINAWRNSLPSFVSEFLQNGTVTVKPNIEDVILYMLYHTLILRLHSPVAFSKFSDMHPIPAQTSKGNCLHSANLILKLSQALPALFQLEPDHVYGLFGPYYAFAVWVCGRIFLVNAIISRGQLDENFESCLSILKSMGTKWDCAIKYADILEFFQDDTMSLDGHSLPGEAGVGSGSQYSEDAKLIADLKLNASSLDSLLSKKITKFKSANAFDSDLLVFDWFKLPLNQSFLSESS